MIIAITRRSIALLLLGGLLLALHQAGVAMAAPSPFEAWSGSSHDPVVLAAEGIRMFAIGVCLWLAAVTLLDTLGVALHAHPLHRIATVLTPVAWRTMVLRPLAVASLALPPVAAPVMAAAPAMAAASPESAPSVGGSDLEMVAVSYEASTLTMSVHESQPQLVVDRTTHVVEPHENLWSIATSHLTESLGRRPTSSEVTAYWRQVIDANYEVLPDPANPDLIYRGIELQMPPIPD